MTSVFSLHGQSLKLNTRADIEPLLKDVDPTQIEEIHFGGNTLGVDASVALGEFLSETTKLRIADFADIFTGRLISEIPQALTSICTALASKSSLVELNLSDNAFGGRSVDPIVPFLTQNRTLQVLKLNNNGLGPAGGEVLANALLESARLSKAAGETSSLRTVICGRNRLEDGSAPSWAEAFAAHGTLVEVRMPQNGIRMEGITALARGLSKCPNLRHLDLQDNTFTADGSLKGVEVWAEALHSWPDLHTLNFSDCVLSSDGEVPKLIEVLAKGSNTKLHTLQLQNNNLETCSFQTLSDGVTSKHLAELKLLEIQWNEAEDDDELLDSLADVMKARGGKLVISDEDEEEDEDNDNEGAEAEAEEEAKEPEAAPEPGKAPSPSKDDAGDELADMMGKVTISP